MYINKCTYICIYKYIIYIYICIHIYIYEYIYAYEYIYVCIYINVHIYVCIYIYMNAATDASKDGSTSDPFINESSINIQTHAHVNLYKHISKYIYICVCIYIHTYIYVYVCTCIFACIYTLFTHTCISKQQVLLLPPMPVKSHVCLFIRKQKGKKYTCPDPTNKVSYTYI